MAPSYKQLEERFKQGKQLLREQRNEEARQLFDDLSRRCPQHPEVFALLGLAQAQRGCLSDARGSLERALRLKPGDPDILRELGRVESLQGRFDDAHSAFDQALASRPDDVLCLVNKAETHRMQGQHDEAISLIRPLLDKEVEASGLPSLLARLAPKFGLEQEAIDLINLTLAGSRISAAVRTRLLFHLGGVYDNLGQYDHAFDAYRQANESKGVSYDPAATTAMVDELIDAWTPQRIASLPRANLDTRLPVFIVGMPRSGTTLVEQILSAHPEVFGAGELDAMSEIAAQLQATSGLPGGALVDLETLNQRSIDRAANTYHKQLEVMDPGASRITDKMPMNFFHLGLIAALFPGATIIHCSRDPLDTCLSCYITEFQGVIRFPYNLTHLGLFHRDYDRLMRHWKNVLPVEILEVSYEQMVADQEGVSRSIVESASLPWDEACLRFFESKRFAMTASNEQVRRPIYSTSVGRHKNYEQHLTPLREALAGDTQSEPDQ